MLKLRHPSSSYAASWDVSVQTRVYVEEVPTASSGASKGNSTAERCIDGASNG